MDAFARFEDARRVREDAKGFDSYVMFGERATEGPGPQIYLNDVDPGVELAAHFHKVDQFQIFFGTPGATFLRRPIGPVFVHYTDAYSTYGPFRAAPDRSLLYATVRAASTNFGGVMPAARADLLYRGRRHLGVDVDGWDEMAPNGSAPQRVDVIPEDPDGLHAELIRLPPNGRIDLPPPSRSAGRSCCVVHGSLVRDGRRFGSRSIVWSSRGDDLTTTLVGGEDGANVVSLSFPWPPTEVARTEDVGVAEGR